jgi:hypothetical protein
LKLDLNKYQRHVAPVLGYHLAFGLEITAQAAHDNLARQLIQINEIEIKRNGKFGQSRALETHPDASIRLFFRSFGVVGQRFSQRVTQRVIDDVFKQRKKIELAEMTKQFGKNFQIEIRIQHRILLGISTINIVYRYKFG